MTVRGAVNVVRERNLERRRRIASVLEREPTLEAWQVAERFGLTVRQAATVIAEELRRWRRGGR